MASTTAGARRHRREHALVHARNVLKRSSVSWDRRLVQALRSGTIRLVSVDFLLKQASTWEMPRLQGLREISDALLPPQTAANLLQCGTRSVFALSYGWLSKGCPDPEGARFAVLQRCFRELVADGQLPQDAALFWDYASLPQKPRTPDDDRIFGEALSVMADLYSSPLGTTVLLLQEIPERPVRFNGRVLVCDVPTGKAAMPVLQQRLSQFGVVRAVTEDASGDIKVRFETHAAARSAVEKFDMKDAFGDGWMCLEYNDRPYPERGWCVLESTVSLEAISRSTVHPDLAAAYNEMALSKVYQLSASGKPQSITPPKPQRASDTVARLQAAKFTGKGDDEKVLAMYCRYQEEFGTMAEFVRHKTLVYNARDRCERSGSWLWCFFIFAILCILTGVFASYGQIGGVIGCAVVPAIMMLCVLHNMVINTSWYATRIAKRRWRQLERYEEHRSKREANERPGDIHILLQPQASESSSKEVPGGGGGGAATHCAQGHALLAATTTSAGFICDLCNKKLPSGVPIMSCRPCDWDACAECAGLFTGPPAVELEAAPV